MSLPPSAVEQTHSSQGGRQHVSPATCVSFSLNYRVGLRWGQSAPLDTERLRLSHLPGRGRADYSPEVGQGASDAADGYETW